MRDTVYFTLPFNSFLFVAYLFRYFNVRLINKKILLNLIIGCPRYMEVLKPFSFAHATTLFLITSG